MIKKLWNTIALLITFSFCVTLSANDTAKTYFPATPDSFWLYEDQDGNEIMRSVIEVTDTASELDVVFGYQSEIEDWAKYNHFMYASLCNLSDDGIKLIVGENMKKSAAALLKAETDIIIERLKPTMPEGVTIDFEISVEVQDKFFLLSDEIVEDEEWDAGNIKATIKMKITDLDDPNPQEITFYFTINETGIVVAKETVKVPAGTFEDCLKVQYITDTTYLTVPEDVADDTESAGESLTTLWFAPGIGVVKFHQERKHMFMEVVPEDEFEMPADPRNITFELKKYEIKTAEPVSDEKEK